MAVVQVYGEQFYVVFMEISEILWETTNFRS